MFPLSTLSAIAASLLLFTSISAESQSAPSEKELIALAESGFPALSREWSAQDYARAKEMITQEKVPLPRLNDPIGTAILRQFTSSENLTFYLNTKIPINDRVPAYISMIESGNAVLMHYMKKVSRGAPISSEITCLLVFTLTNGAIGIKLVDEFIPTIAKDEKYEVRMRGLAQMKRGVLSVFSGAEQSLGEPYYTARDHSVLLHGMAESLTGMIGVFPADFRAEMRKKLEARRPAFQQEADTKALNGMIEKLAQ